MARPDPADRRPPVGRVYGLLVDDDEDHGRGDLRGDPAAVPGNGVKLVTAMTLQKIGDRVVDAKTVLAGWGILAALALFSLSRSLSSISAKDVLGRTIPKGRRGPDHRRGHRDLRTRRDHGRGRPGLPGGAGARRGPRRP